ncbi:hypothetical protein HDK77DRAFT_145482 [Phyllosticta capitalensis]
MNKQCSPWCGLLLAASIHSADLKSCQSCTSTKWSGGLLFSAVLMSWMTGSQRSPTRCARAMGESMDGRCGLTDIFCCSTVSISWTPGNKMQNALVLLLRPGALQVQLQYLVLVVQDRALLFEHVELVSSVIGPHLIFHRRRRIEVMRDRARGRSILSRTPGLGARDILPSRDVQFDDSSNHGQ